MRLSISVASFVPLGEEIYSSRARIRAQAGLGPHLRPEALGMTEMQGREDPGAL